MSKTVVGLFSSIEEANRVKQALTTQGFNGSQVRVVANGEYEDDVTTGSTTGSSAYENEGASTGLGSRISAFFHSLTGGDEDVHNHYASGINQGGALLTATVDDSRAAEVAALLKQHGAKDLDDRYEGAAESGTPVYGQNTGSAVDGGTAIPIVEEQLVVGKREVDRGGVRVYSHVVERPVEEEISLRDERIGVARRAVNRPATAADFETGTGSFELRASGEEAVVGKTSRVVEEVIVGKETGQHTEAIHDSVRKTEVDVEQIPGERLTSERR